jgi:hypothetical protein
MIFYDYTLVAGSQVSRRTQDSAQLLPAAVDFFGDMLLRHGDAFRQPVPGLPGYELEWTCQGAGAAMVTFWHGQVPVTTSALLARIDPAADRLVALELHQLVLRCHGDSPLEPGFDVLAIAERPVLLTLILPSSLAAGREAIAMIADMKTCLAAAFFTRPGN